MSSAINPHLVHGGFSSPSVGGQSLKRLRDQVEQENSIEFIKAAADGAAATATAETVIGFCPLARVAAKIRYVPSAALTADNANYATLIVRKRDSAGGTATVLKQVTTQITGTGNWTAFVAVDFGTLTVSAVEALSSLTFEITKTGSGVAVPSGSLVIEFS